jgi:hypothetical protein
VWFSSLLAMECVDSAQHCRQLRGRGRDAGATLAQ